MTIREVSTPQHWNYFLALEEDFSRLTRYIEPTTSNFEVHSLELARVLFGAASEVDVVAKLLCKQIDAASRADKISSYKDEIMRAYPKIATSQVHIPRFGLSLLPWENWGKGSSPDWWKSYNNVKHQRDAHFSEANLKNALNSVGALFSMLLFFYRAEAEIGELSPDPVLFRIGEPFVISHTFYAPHALMYKLN